MSQFGAGPTNLDNSIFLKHVDLALKLRGNLGDFTLEIFLAVLQIDVLVFECFKLVWEDALSRHPSTFGDASSFVLDLRALMAFKLAYKFHKNKFKWTERLKNKTYGCLLPFCCSLPRKRSRAQAGRSALPKGSGYK